MENTVVERWHDDFSRMFYPTQPSRLLFYLILEAFFVERKAYPRNRFLHVCFHQTHFFVAYFYIYMIHYKNMNSRGSSRKIYIFIKCLQSFKSCLRPLCHHKNPCLTLLLQAHTAHHCLYSKHFNRTSRF